MNWRLRYKDTTVPCYECPDRYVVCHAKCERYAIYDRMRNDQREAALKMIDVKDYVRDSIRRTMRKKYRR